MTTTEYSTSHNGYGSLRLSTRDILSIGFRHKHAIVITFCGILLGALLAAMLQPAKYQASTKLLLQHARIDPVVSPDQDSRAVRTEVTEEEMNSEVELLRSEDVLRQVVLASGLQQRTSFLSFLWPTKDEQTRVAKAVVRLRKDLAIEPVKKSNIIEVLYSSTDRGLAARVLQALDEAYVQKNVAVHHPPGQLQFFDQEAERYRKNLADAETQLKTFSQQEGGVSPQLTRDITLQKLSEFNASLQQTNAELAAAEQRINELEQQSGTTPRRLTTQARAIDDAQVLQGLKSTLMNLELKRTELLTKYQPSYPLVQEVDKQIADARSAIAREESKPLREETTDQNPTYAWINEELAKAKADYSGLQARAAAIRTIVAKYKAQAHDLEEKGIVQQDLLRDVKTQEENYLLYQHKQEEARMTDALDRTRIVNVVIAEQPSVPTLPSNSPWITLLLGMLLASSVSVALAWALEYVDVTFRTPAEVFSELNVPVLAAVPQKWNGGASHNGNGQGRGSAFPPGNGATQPTETSHSAEDQNVQP
jgi:uncharacterized protein involved in exopolysaccharide biosynthesis